MQHALLPRRTPTATPVAGRPHTPACHIQHATHSTCHTQHATPSIPHAARHTAQPTPTPPPANARIPARPSQQTEPDGWPKRVARLAGRLGLDRAGATRASPPSAAPSEAAPRPRSVPPPPHPDRKRSCRGRGGVLREFAVRREPRVVEPVPLAPPPLSATAPRRRPTPTASSQSRVAARPVEQMAQDGIGWHRMA